MVGQALAQIIWCLYASTVIFALVPSIFWHDVFGNLIVRSTRGDLVVASWLGGSLLIYGYYKIYNVAISSLEKLTQPRLSRWLNQNFLPVSLLILSPFTFPFSIQLAAFPIMYIVETTGIHLHFMLFPLWYLLSVVSDIPLLADPIWLYQVPYRE